MICIYQNILNVVLHLISFKLNHYKLINFYNNFIFFISITISLFENNEQKETEEIFNLISFLMYLIIDKE